MGRDCFQEPICAAALHAPEPQGGSEETSGLPVEGEKAAGGSPLVRGMVPPEIKDRGRDRMSDNVDLTELTAGELVAYGERAGWTTDELREALAYRESLQVLDRSTASLRQTMNDPTVLEAIRICEEQPSVKEPRSWFARLKQWLSQPL